MLFTKYQMTICSCWPAETISNSNLWCFMWVFFLTVGKHSSWCFLPLVLIANKSFCLQIILSSTYHLLLSSGDGWRCLCLKKTKVLLIFKSDSEERCSNESVSTWLSWIFWLHADFFFTAKFLQLWPFNYGSMWPLPDKKEKSAHFILKTLV